MKRFYSISFFVILISLLAAGAYAQSDDGECTEQKTRNLNYDEEWGNGGTVRNGGDYAEEGGPHGPVGDGPDDVDKAFIDEDGDGFNDVIMNAGEGMSQLGTLGADATKTQSGQMLRNDYGPGEAGVETPVGPQDSPHFGPGESSGEGEPVVNSDPVQSRSGRR